MDWLLGNIGSILEMVASVVAAASVLDRISPRMDISNETRRANKAISFIRKGLSFAALNNFGAVGMKSK